MGKFDGILICTDLDGTLYRNDKTISEENREAIEYFKREGGYFTFITGRMPYYSQNAYNAVNPNVPFGCINGGGVYDGEKGEYVWVTHLPADVTELVACIEEAFPEAGIQASTYYHTYFSRMNDAMEIFRQRSALPDLRKNYRDVDEPIGKVIFATFREEEILGIERTLRNHPRAQDFDFIRSEQTLFEILPKGVNKGLAISKLIEYLHVDAKKTVAIGDYFNDISMFGPAGLGVAVANACQAAKDAADVVTVSNEEHAVARVIYDLESGKMEL